MISIHMISIIVPIYNAGNYLAPCLDSILAQTETKLQIILVDDGSTDGSYAVAQSFADKDPRIMLLQQPHAGQSAARNTGLEHAEGEFVAFVDADDRIQPDWCEVMLRAIQELDYVQSSYLRIREGEVAQLKIPKNKYQFTSPCMRLYRHKAIQGLRFTEGMIYEDVIWSVDLWLRHATCAIIHYPGYYYTYNPDSTTSRRHPEAEKKLFYELKKRLAGASFRGKMIIYYTILRLKLHFLRS